MRAPGYPVSHFVSEGEAFTWLHVDSAGACCLTLIEGTGEQSPVPPLTSVSINSLICGLNFSHSGGCAVCFAETAPSGMQGTLGSLQELLPLIQCEQSWRREEQLCNLCCSDSWGSGAAHPGSELRGERFWFQSFVKWTIHQKWIKNPSKRTTFHGNEGCLQGILDLCVLA